MKKLRNIAILSAFCMYGTQALSEDIAEGTILSKDNLATLENQTLDGHKIKDLLLPTQRTLIEKYNKKMKLIHRTEIKHHPLIEELTKKYANQVKFDEKTRTPMGFVGGVPFPELKVEDPNAGIKLAFNFMWSPWLGETNVLPPAILLVGNAKNGLEREIGMDYRRFLVQGRLHEPHKLDDQIMKYEMAFFVYPNDIKGIGLLTVQYVDGRLPDVYAYIKAVRRVRRLSSGAWADPLSGTDLMNDETFGMNADPRWYKSWKLIGKKWILASAHGMSEGYNKNERDPAKRFPVMDFSAPPYWNFLEQWEPREAWHVEAQMPDTHINSKKVQYYDADVYAPMLHWQDLYDRKGSLWRILNCNYREITGGDGVRASTVGIVQAVDFQREHATTMYNSPDYKINFKADINDFTPQAIPRIVQ